MSSFLTGVEVVDDERKRARPVARFFLKLMSGCFVVHALISLEISIESEEMRSRLGCMYGVCVSRVPLRAAREPDGIKGRTVIAQARNRLRFE